MNSAFPKLFAIGTGYIADLFEGDVEVTEKIDGSQFGFGKSKDGELFIRSKGKLQPIDAPDKMFEVGADYVKSIADRLPNGYTFYGEYLNKPRHSTLAYDRVPKNNIILFGVKKDDETYESDFDAIAKFAEILDIESVPLLFRGRIGSTDELLAHLETVSTLGGQKIEGVVVKRYEPWLFGGVPMPLKGGKYVSESFKEVHSADWSKENTTKGKWETFKDNYRTEARFNKAVQHLEDDGLLTRTPKDIGLLIKEARHDIVTEEKEVIKDFLWQEFSDDLLKVATRGLPEWYKKKLITDSFAEQIEEGDAEETVLCD